MRNPFFANPPRPVAASRLIVHCTLLVQRFGVLIKQILTPFRSQPEDVDAFPESDSSVTEATVTQCQWLFDEAEERRERLEQKAQGTFSLMIFLVPLLASAFVFILEKTSLGSLRVVTILLVCTSGAFLLLGFISAIRAVGVKASQTLSINAVLREDGTFRPYEEAFHAKGLLWCASMNSAMNDHLAQFVRGAHTMTATAVVLLLVASLPVSRAVLNQSREPTATKVVGPVDIVLPSTSTGNQGKPCLDAEAYALRIDALEKKVAQLDADKKRRVR